MNSLRILIADDHAVVRIGLSSLLESEKDMLIVGQAKNGEEAVYLSRSLHPDIIIMDLMMPKLDGTAATTAILSRQPDAKIIVLTTFGASDSVAHALAAGARGAITKTAEDAALVTAIREVAKGNRIISPDIQQLLSDNPPVPGLSPRQREILTSITHGLTNKAIAHQLGISSRSVEEHVNAILNKLGASSRAEAVAIALRKHLLKI